MLIIRKDVELYITVNKVTESFDSVQAFLKHIGIFFPLDIKIKYRINPAKDLILLCWQDEPECARKNLSE